MSCAASRRFFVGERYAIKRLSCAIKLALIESELFKNNKFKPLISGNFSLDSPLQSLLYNSYDGYMSSC